MATSGDSETTIPLVETGGDGVVVAWADPAILNPDPMANKYFQFFENKAYDADRHLFDTLQAEAFNHQGNPCMYYKISYDTTYDPLFGVDDTRRIERRFPCKAVFELQKETENYGPFAIEGLDTFPMYVSKRHFEAASQYVTSGVKNYPPMTENDPKRNVYEAVVPVVGDIIRAEFNNRYYEIKDVGEEEEMFLQGKHSWTFIVEEMSDKRLLLNPDTSGAMGDIQDFQNIPDVFDSKPQVDIEKDDVLYDSSAAGDPDTNQDPLGGWFN